MYDTGFVFHLSGAAPRLLSSRVAGSAPNPPEERMQSSDESPKIREEDVESRPIERRAFLGRFGAVAGMAGLLGWTAGCSDNSSDACDQDSGDPVDQDPGDPADSDLGDPCDSD